MPFTSFIEAANAMPILERTFHHYVARYLPVQFHIKSCLHEVTLYLFPVFPNTMAWHGMAFTCVLIAWWMDWKPSHSLVLVAKWKLEQNRE